MAGLLAWSILVVIHLKAVRGRIGAVRIGPSWPVLVTWIATALVAVLPFLVAGVSLLLQPRAPKPRPLSRSALRRLWVVAIGRPSA